MEENINTLIEKINEDYNNDKYMNYIKYIQFPKYKNLTNDTKIEFTFPLTMLVGKNGTGKSSVLQAIYGCPKGKSTGDYWFTTAVDPIEEGKNKYFYGYKKDSASRIKEVIKKRQNSVKAPDYWESDALDIKVGMKPDDNMDKETRNNPVDKDVVYFDFRGELSAFDKYFHFYKSKTDHKTRMFEQKNKESKEYVKKQSRLLMRAFKGEKVAYWNHPKNILHDNLEVIDVKNGREKLEAINFILGKEYIEIRRIYHRIYQTWGNSILLKTKNGIQYSEANAGSGENAIINMVCAIMDAKRDSLILLDEPEVSLHPSAQIKLKFFLLNMTMKKHHQIIISTHSMMLIEEMPKQAIKLFEVNDNGSTDVINDVYYQEAFYSIKEKVDRKNLILCEDTSAKVLIEGILSHLKIENYFTVEYRHGGADTLITKHLPILALDEMYDKVFIILDGDKKPENLIKYSNIPVGEINDIKKLEKYIRNLTTSNSIISPLVDGGKNGAVESQKIDVYKKYLKYAQDHLYYLPGNCIPESIVLQSELTRTTYQNNIIEPIDNSNSKDSIMNICINIFEKDIYMTSTMVMLTKMWIKDSENAQYYNEMVNMMRKIYNYCNSN
ncbi:MAG: ATP-binding protein [Roseburia sp.]|nr:ATP-binding protein [Roseburia sp.]